MPKTHGGSIGHNIHAHDMTRLTCAPPAPTDGGSTGSTGSAVGPGVETITVSFFGHSCLSRKCFRLVGFGARSSKKKEGPTERVSNGVERRSSPRGDSR